MLALPAIIAGLTIHEFAHAWAADKLGDDTPRRMGRLTIDPLAHIDPIGAIFMALAWLSGFGIGWAKPVPFNPRNLENPRRDAILIAIAGPISNLLQIPFWMALLWLASRFFPMTASLGEEAMSASYIVNRILAAGITTNLLLAAFNMLPIPPLDGHYVLEGLGPPYVAEFYNTIRPWSFFLLIVLLQTPLIGMALRPVAIFGMQLVFLSEGLGWVDLGFYR